MKHLVAITALSLFALPAFAQQAPTVELPTAAVLTVMNAYLHPSKVEPGDALAAVNLIDACAQMQAQPGTVRDTGRCPEVAAALHAREAAAKKAAPPETVKPH